MKYLIIDERMRELEKNTLKNLGYELIELKQSNNVYEEISSHTDIFMCKINDKLIVEGHIYKQLEDKIINIEKGNSLVSFKYPEDIKYNVCVFGNFAIHNFKYTDTKILEELQKGNYKFINVSQGYSNCSIAVIDDNSIITADTGIYNKLKDENIDILFLEDNLDIKLLRNNEYSNKNGFIGGAVARIDDNIIIFGDLNNIDKNGKIRLFIESKGLNIIDFKGIDIIDYGGIVKI